MPALTAQDLRPGDILTMRADSIAKLPAGDPTRMVCEAILAGESLMDKNPAYFHVGVVADPSQALVLEELPQGETQDADSPTDSRWDVYRLDLTPEQLAAFLGALKDRLGQRYGYEDYAYIGGIRVLHLPLTHPAYTAPAVCSSVVAEALAVAGLHPWPGVDPSLTIPSDFPGAGMRLVAEAGQLVEAA